MPRGRHAPYTEAQGSSPGGPVACQRNYRDMLLVSREPLMNCHSGWSGAETRNPGVSLQWVMDSRFRGNDKLLF
jgi:hypothetical protein